MYRHIVAYIRAHRDTYTPAAMRAALVEAGYPEDQIDAALKEEEATEPALGPDQRPRAALIATGAAALMFLVYWIYQAGYSGPAYGGGVWLAQLLAMVLGVGLLIALIPIYFSKKLRQGVEGALVGGLVIPFVILFGIFGTCLVTTVR